MSQVPIIPSNLHSASKILLQLLNTLPGSHSIVTHRKYKLPRGSSTTAYRWVTLTTSGRNMLIQKAQEELRGLENNSVQSNSSGVGRVVTCDPP